LGGGGGGGLGTCEDEGYANISIAK